MSSFTITIDDQDALDALQHIIDANGIGEKTEDVIVGLLIPQLVAMREQQLVNAAQVRATQDPDVLEFKARQAKKGADSIPLAEPAVEATP